MASLTISLTKRLIAFTLCLTLALTFAFAQPTPAHAQGDCGDTVTVQPGDTLRDIASICETTVPAILEVNPDITNPNLIVVGQVINLPGGGGDGDDDGAEEQATIAPTSGPPGTNVDVAIANFPANTGLVVTLALREGPIVSQQEIGTASTGSTGTVVAIPEDAQEGEQYVVSVDDPDVRGGTATAQPFSVTDTMDEGEARSTTIAPTSGPPGSLAQLAASGFAPNSNVEIGFGPVESEYGIIATATTDSDGELTRQVRIPNSVRPGEYVYVVLPAGTSDETISNEFTVTGDGVEIDPQVNISPRSGPPGSNIQINASGFPANTRVSYGIGELESETFDVFSARTNRNGSVQVFVQVPEAIAAGTELVALVYVPQRQDARATSNIFTVTQQDGGEGNLFTRTNIYLIALEDAGRNGQEIGCSDSVIPVEVEIEPTIAPLTAALETLFSIDERFYGQSGLYNSLYRADLAVERIDIVDDVATIYLTGDFAIGGVCDSPRVRAQLEETALQYATVDEVQIFINGESLDSLLSERG